MSPHEHVTTSKLEAYVADPGRVSVEEQVRLAVQLSKGCAECWSAVDELPSRDPRRTTDPLARALYRYRSSYYDLTLPNAHLRLVRDLEPGLDVARLVLEEDLLMGLQAAPGEVEKHLDMADRLLMAWTIELPNVVGEIPEPWKLYDLVIRWAGAFVQLVGHTQEVEQIVAEAAQNVAACSEFPGNDERQIELALARLRLAESAGREAEVAECFARYIDHVESWAQRFEIYAELNLRKAARSSLDFNEAAVPVILAVATLDELDHVNYLFHLARYVTGIGEEIRRRAGWRIVERDTASALEARIESITRLGDVASITLAYELLGDLHTEPLDGSELERGRRELRQAAADLAQLVDGVAAPKNEEAVHVLIH